ncbi:MAG: SDR family oxidoreductase [Bdellovibrionales bacterium]|nr:SDR family oxidoreductase [Bdellovibrionales bacterium]
MFDPNLYKDKVILVTGGGSGLGLAMAKLFAQLGAQTVICGRNANRLQQGQQEIGAGGLEPLCVALDVRDEASVNDCIAKVTSTFGTIDGLINNAAGNFYCPSEDLTENAFRSVVDIVLTGTFFCSKAFGKYLIDHHKSGSILNIVTTYTESGSAFVLPSACAKAGVEAMTKSLAFEWAEYGIRVNAIAPGPMPTEGAWKRLMPDPTLEDKYKQSLPLKRFGKHEELARLACFLMSDDVGYITGETVTIDGAEKYKGGPFNFLTDFASREELRTIFRSMRPKK